MPALCSHAEKNGVFPSLTMLYRRVLCPLICIATPGPLTAGGCEPIVLSGRSSLYPAGFLAAPGGACPGRVRDCWYAL